MTQSLRETITSYRKTTTVEACGTTVHLRAMSGPETVSLHQWQQEADPKRVAFDVYVQVLLRTLCDENGDRLFTDDDAEQLATIPTIELQKLYAAASTLNGLSGKAVDDAEGN